MQQKEHSIIYTGDKAPKKLPGEIKLSKAPIKVVPVNGQDLEPPSRVNFAKTYPIEHNVKILEVGMVAKKDLRTFLGYWQNETEQGFPERRPHEGKAAPRMDNEGRKRHT